MRPVRTAESNVRYGGDGNEIADVWARIDTLGEEEGDEDNPYAGTTVVKIIWEPTLSERARIMDGANIELELMGSPIQPHMLKVTNKVRHGRQDPWPGEGNPEAPE